MFCRQRPDFYAPGTSQKVLDQSVIGSGDESPSTATTKSDLTFGDDPFPRNKWVANKDRHIDDDSKPSKLFTYSHKRQKLRKTLDHFNDATVLALYGDNFETEPLLQARILIMVCIYLCPFASGFTTSLLSLNRQTSSPLPDWTDHLLFLGGLTGSVTGLVFFLRFAGRIRTSAFVSVILFVSSILILFSDPSTLWMKRLAEISTGFALGLQLPTQYLITAEVGTPERRTVLSLLNYVALALGSLLPHLLCKLVRLQGLCIFNCIVLVSHFVVVGIFHPETPRFLFAAKDRKSDCVNSLQWLRGKRADIGMEYAEMADTPNMIRRSEIRSLIQVFLQRQVNQPLITAATLMTLTSLSGLLSMTFLLRCNFQPKDANLGPENLLDVQQVYEPPIQIGYVVAAVTVLAPVATCIFVNRVSRKTLMLLSASLMAAATIFVALMVHFRADVQQSYGWTLQTGGVIFLIAHHSGMGPLSWVYLSELIPLSALELGTALAASCWWAFNLVFSVTFSSLVMAVGVQGVCLIHAIVSGLTYGFVLLAVPDIGVASLQEIERFFMRLVETEKIFPNAENISDENRPKSSLT